MEKIIKGYENYIVTSEGCVINQRKGTCKKPTSNKQGRGYFYVDLYNNGKHKRFYVHRLVAEAFVENPNNKPFVNHKDGDTSNNKAENLEWVTPLENVEHASNVLGVLTAYKNSNYKKHIVKLVEDLSILYDVDFTKLMEKAQRKEIKLSWCYVEEQK